MKPHRIRGTPENVQEMARELRHNQTKAEALLWEKLRDRRVGGLKIRRQHLLGPFIADFYCAAHRLVIEIDGEIHSYQRQQDEHRTDQFEALGYRVIRFRNQEVEQDMEGVLKKIIEACKG